MAPDRYSGNARSRKIASGSTVGMKRKPSHKTEDQARERNSSTIRKEPMIRSSYLGEEMKTLRSLESEVEGYWDILLGRVDPPFDNGILTLMEIATGIFTRCSEITATLQKLEYKDSVSKGDNLYRFRTGPLRTLMEASSKAIELGSRRVTAARIEVEMRDEL